MSDCAEGIVCRGREARILPGQGHHADIKLEDTKVSKDKKSQKLLDKERTKKPTERLLEGHRCKRHLHKGNKLQEVNQIPFCIICGHRPSFSFFI